MAKIKLAEGLLRRKELQAKVKQLETIKTSNLFEVKSTRKHAHEGIDDVVAQVPKLTAAQVTHEYDFYASRLRKIDAVIQQTNWQTEIEVGIEVMTDYQLPA